jgi:hypothetical protein
MVPVGAITASVPFEAPHPLRPATHARSLIPQPDPAMNRIHSRALQRNMGPQGNCMWRGGVVDTACLLMTSVRFNRGGRQDDDTVRPRHQHTIAAPACRLTLPTLQDPQRFSSMARAYHHPHTTATSSLSAALSHPHSTSTRGTQQRFNPRAADRAPCNNRTPPPLLFPTTTPAASRPYAHKRFEIVLRQRRYAPRTDVTPRPGVHTLVADLSMLSPLPAEPIQSTMPILPYLIRLMHVL